MHIERYLADISSSGAVSEIAYYTPLATRICHEILNYPLKNLLINKSGSSGIPDIRVLSVHDRSEWVVCEAKLNDEEIRDESWRRRLWQDQVVAKRYIGPETVFVLLCSPLAFRICNVNGAVVGGVDIVPERQVVRDAKTGEELPLKDASIKALLRLVSAQASEERPQYVAFRQGSLEGGYIPLEPDTLHLLRPVFEYGLRELKKYCSDAFEIIKNEFALAEAEREKIKEQLVIVGTESKLLGRVKNRERAIKRKYRTALQVMEEDYPQFKHDQAYAGTEKEHHFEDIFVTNAAYVALTRLFFVRICEDLELTTRKVSHEGPGLWSRFVQHIKYQYKDLLAVAYQDASHIYSRLFESTVFDWGGEGNGQLNRILEEILFRLNAFSFANVDRDLLGAVYQYFRPRAERKRLGEYYTPAEVVDYILARTGIARDPDLLVKRILDPACGSFTFGVRAIVPLLEAGGRLTARNKIAAVRKCLAGRDINPFSVFLSHLSLLFTMLETYRDAKIEDPEFRLGGFDVANLNSLAPESHQAELALGLDETNEGITDKVFDYVVGNPPFVRNERLPDNDREALEATFANLRSGNTDLATYFLYSALNSWLKEGGVLGMVAPIGQANSDNAKTLRTILAQYTIFEIVSLEWMAKEVFPDADIIPMLLFVKKQAPPKDHKISVVSGLASKAELAEATAEGAFRSQHVSEIDYERWLNVSPTGDWPLDVTARDIPILEKLKEGPRLSSAAQAKYGIKPGGGVTGLIRLLEGTKRGGSEVEMAMGQHVCAFGITNMVEALDLDRIARASDRSLWGDLTFFRNNAGIRNDTGLEFEFKQTSLLSASSPSDTLYCVVPAIYTTLVAAVADPLEIAAHNSVLIAVPEKSSAYVLAGIINSQLCRYFSFLTMRAAILLRRRCNWYPRVLKNLPWPSLPAQTAQRLHDLSKQATAVSGGTSLNEVDVYSSAIANINDMAEAGRLGVHMESALDAIDVSDLAAAVQEGNALRAGQATVHAADPDTLLLAKMAALAGEAELLDSQALQELMLPANAADRARIAADVRDLERKLEDAKSRMEAITEEIDEIVAAGLGISLQEHAVIRQRCTEFPLSVTVGRPRYVWSPDRKRQARRVYAQGQRFK